MPPLALSDDQFTMIQRAAEPHDLDLGAPFLQTVAHLLASESEIGDGSVSRACREAQREFFRSREGRAGIGKHHR
jgi:hypothetical protein